MCSSPVYNVFVSRNGTGHGWVRRLVRQLRAGGYSVFFDEDSIPQDRHPDGVVEEAMARSSWIVLALSPAALGREWPALQAAGRSLLRAEAPTGQEVISVLVEPVDVSEIPRSLRGGKLINLTGQQARVDFVRLLGLLGVPTDRIPAFVEGLAGGRDAEGPARNPRIVHELPAAPHFVGRQAEVESLWRFWESPGSGVLALVGMGGAGKTALATRLYTELLAEDCPQLGGLFVWSFYEDADPAAFLETAYEYFTGEKRTRVKGAGWLHLLKDVLSNGERHLLILDGLERVQHGYPSETEGRRFGQIEDSLLREFLKRMASGAGRAKAIVTTRFPVVDLAEHAGGSTHHIALDELDESSALLLLRMHQVQGTDAQLAMLTHRFGRHALTLDLLGGLLEKYCDGRPELAPDLATLNLDEWDRQEHHLASVFRAYERYLGERELAVLSRLCIFRFGATVSSFHEAFVNTDRASVSGPLTGLGLLDIKGLFHVLVGLHLVLREGDDRYTVHPAVRDHFYMRFTGARELHTAASSYFSTLAARPGAKLPTGKEALDQLEELIYHLIAAGKIALARTVYQERLGGVWHLTRLGEFARGLRILSEFPTVFDRDGWFRYRRGVGDLPTEEEWSRFAHELTFFSTHGPENTRLLRGQLADLNLTAAHHLRGTGDGNVFFSNEFAPRFSAILLSSRLSDFRDITYGTLVPTYRDPRTGSIVTSEEVWQTKGYWIHLLETGQEHSSSALHRYMLGKYQVEVSFHMSFGGHQDGDNAAVVSLWAAELSRTDGDLASCRSHIEKASEWILHSSSQEHLAILHLVRARLATDTGDTAAADSALEEGIDIASRCRFPILLIDLLNERARLSLRMNRTEIADEAARRAMSLASEKHCGYVWGKALAAHYLAMALRSKGQAKEARNVEKAVPLSRRMFKRSAFLRGLRE